MVDTKGPAYPERSDFDDVFEIVMGEARNYLAGLDERPVRSRNVDEAARSFEAGLPEQGDGTAQTLRDLIDHGIDAAAHTSGPRCYHFVMGGTTPAALGADWLASTLDQAAYAWVSSPLGVKLETIAIDWLKDLFRLPADWTGVMTTGATMANFVGLAAARQWWGEQQGVDVSQQGFHDLPRVPVLSGGYIHASSVKCLSMLGMGRGAATTFSRDDLGRLDIDAMSRALDGLKGAPAILIANAGEVNAGDFDPLSEIVSLAAKHNTWLHVDGAFGLFARISPRTEPLVAGLEKADSATVDGHKWLNVPYDCGFSFVRDVSLLRKAFAYTAAYLPGDEDPNPNMGAIGPESSRRARSFSVWATLKAYGRQGYRRMVEGHLDLAQRLAGLVDDAPELERLAEVPLNIVCFRYNPGGVPEAELNRLNAALGQAILEDGRVYVGTTRFGSRTALRPALVNWRTRESDIDFFVSVVRELAARLAVSPA